MAKWGVEIREFQKGDTDLNRQRDLVGRREYVGEHVRWKAAPEGGIHGHTVIGDSQ